MTPDSVDFVEVVAESCFVQSNLRREARALASVWPVIPHGVKLSLGSADGIHVDKARQLSRLVTELGAPLVSEHVAFTRGRDREIGHLTPLPRTRQAVRVVARNVATLRRQLPDVPLLLENIAHTFAWPDDEMDEPTFYHEIVDATGCGLLLDLSNLWANATNEGVDPLKVLAAYPLDRVGMVHLAGGGFEHGFYFDTHAAPIHDSLFTLVDALVERRGPVPILIERDADFGPFADLVGELTRLRMAQATSRVVSATRDASRSDVVAVCIRANEARDRDTPSSHSLASDQLASDQHELACALTRAESPESSLVQRFGAEPLERTRRVLLRKRVEDALPLIPHIAASPGGRMLAEATIDRSLRPARMVSVVDAIRIADAAAKVDALAIRAKLDRLFLRARFAGPDRAGRIRPRWAPFVGRGLGIDHKSLWVFKGVGTTATVRQASAG